MSEADVCIFTRFCSPLVAFVGAVVLLFLVAAARDAYGSHTVDLDGCCQSLSVNPNIGTPPT